MSPRVYRKNRRAEHERETHDRILRAAADLHARHGATGTSFAMIARRAGVSPQTVYNHFPSLGELVKGCTGHVQQGAPVVDESVLSDEDDSARRLSALTRAVYRQLHYLAPWLRLGHTEVERVPELAEMFEQQQKALGGLIRQAVVAPREPTDSFVDAALILLSYPAYVQFTASREIEEAADLAASCLVSLLEPLTH
ncbi:TetR/AcrR family transcriptional regulator [Elongatibacter sediminis]|uniref:TetR/AcrR family transcriptional regulator n=1 Tax=Elongatibacter sediminis TaxID=3119006 RepID=A0AAW9R6L3_9GAMM